MTPQIIATISEADIDTGTERESIPVALSMTREAWVDKTHSDYWDGIPAAERRNLAGLLWDRIHRLSRRAAA